MFNIISALVLNVVVSNAAYVDRVEDIDATRSIAVVCMGFEGACFDVPTTRKGLQEGDMGLKVCESHKRLDGTYAVVCQGSTVAFIRADGSWMSNPYAMPVSAECEQY
jgi:hypothetical protein